MLCVSKKARCISRFTHSLLYSIYYYICSFLTARTEGFLGLYKGLGPGLTSIIPYIGISFTMYDELKLRFSNQEGDSPSSIFAKHLLVGAGSGVIAQSITYPLGRVAISSIVLSCSEHARFALLLY
jgi:hypothetical protein